MVAAVNSGSGSDSSTGVYIYLASTTDSPTGIINIITYNPNHNY